MRPIFNDTPDPGGSDPGGDSCSWQLYHPPDQENAGFKAVFRSLPDPGGMKSPKSLITPQMH